MKVLIVGGTGFVGHHIVRKMLAHGHDVAVLARNEPETPSAATVHLGDVQRLSDCELAELVADREAVVYAAAAAVQAPVGTDIDAELTAATVDPAVRLLTAARQAGCDRAVLLGSYYLALHRQHPEWRLPEGSAYIRSRLRQSVLTRAAAGDSLALATLELPFVLGATPGRTAAVAPLVRNMAQGKDVVVFPGGTAVATVDEVADATIAALELRADGDFPVVTANLGWDEFLRRLAVQGGHTPSRVWRLNRWQTTALFRLLALAQRRQGLQPGYTSASLGMIHSTDLFLDVSLPFGVKQADLDEALRATAVG